MNGATRPGGAFKSVTEQLPNNTRVVIKMDVFGGVVISGIGAAPHSLADRSIRIPFQRETADLTQDLAKFFGRTDATLIAVRDDLATWAGALAEPLSEPPLPDWLVRQSGRTAGNWLLLLTIADAAGGRWPGLVQSAATAEFQSERETSEFERLLASVSRCFAAQKVWDHSVDKEPLNHADRVTTGVLLAFLNDDTVEEWDRSHSGKPVNHYWLRKILRNQLSPAGAQDWWTGPEAKRQHHSGYYLTQFTDAWRRYQVPTPDVLVATAEAAAEAAAAEDARKRANGHDTAPPPSDAGATVEPEASEAKPRRARVKPAPLPEPEPVAATSTGDAELHAAMADGDFNSELAATRAAHPDWDARRLAKAMKQPLERVERRLGPFH